MPPRTPRSSSRSKSISLSPLQNGGSRRKSSRYRSPRSRRPASPDYSPRRNGRRPYSRSVTPPPLLPGSSSSRRRKDTRSRSESMRSPSRSFSRSPTSSERHRGTREKPKASRCIGVFGLSVFTTQHKIREIFSKFGPIERIQVVIDAQTGRSRGFCFIYYENIADATAAKNACCGLEIDDRRIRVDYSITNRPHTPTPGVYMGKPTSYYKEKKRVRPNGSEYRYPSYVRGPRSLDHGGEGGRTRDYRDREYDYYYQRSSHRDYYMRERSRSPIGGRGGSVSRYYGKERDRSRSRSPRRLRY